MEEKELHLIQELVPKDKELEQLWKEHQEFEKKLDELNNKTYLTVEEEFEKKRIQKLKLIGKDRISLILTRYRSGRAQ